MALVFMDGFDAYADSTSVNVAAPLLRKWGDSSGQVTASPRTPGGFALLLGGNLETHPLTSRQTWIVGFGFQNDSTSQTAKEIFYIRDNNTTQCSVALTSSGLLEISRSAGGGATVLATGTTPLALEAWYHIQVKVTIDNSTGYLAVRLNNVLEVEATSVDTQVSSNATANRFEFNDIGNAGQQIRIDDFWVCDDTGSTNNDWLGDLKIETLVPNAIGNYSQWTPTSGDNYTNVDELAPNDDTDYVATSTANNIDTYGFTDLSAIVSDIKATQLNLQTRKDAAGAKSIASLARISATDYTGATKSVIDSYLTSNEIYETNPNTASAWTVSDVNGAEFGAKLIS